jgi:RHS repeat-associated protein
MFVDKAGTAAAVLDDNDFYPWGGLVPGVGKTTSNNTIKFTGKYRDTESGLDYFGARYYANAMGRFMSPDWAAKPVTVPYAKFGDPQSLNLYGYVENGPVNRIDADGHTLAGWTSAGDTWMPTGGYGGVNDGGLGAVGGSTMMEISSTGEDQQALLDWASSLAAAAASDLGRPHCICDKFPKDPSGLGPEWSPDTSYKYPHGKRFRRADGWGIDFHEGKPGKGRRAKGGKDHWHVVEPGTNKKSDEHFLPGQDMPIPNSPFSLPIPDGLQGPADPVPALPPGYVYPCAGCDPVPAGPRPFFTPIPGPGTTIPSPEPVLVPEPVVVG